MDLIIRANSTEMARLSQERCYSSHSVQLKTPWSSMTPDECEAISEKIKKRKPVMACAPGLTPASSPPAAPALLSHPQGVEKDPPPLPPTRLNTPGVVVAKRIDAIKKGSTTLSDADKSKSMDERQAHSSTGKLASVAPILDNGPSDSLGKDKAPSQLLGSSFGSPTSLAEAVKEGMQDDKIAQEGRSSGLSFVAPMPQNQPLPSSTSRVSLFNLGDPAASVLGSPAMSPEKSSLSAPGLQTPESELAGVLLSKPSKAEPYTGSMQPSTAKDPSPFAAALPEDAQDLGDASAELNFSGLGFGQVGKGAPPLSFPGATLAFGAVSTPPPPPAMEAMQDTKAASPLVSFSTFGGVSGQTSNDQTAGGVFGGFGQKASMQEQLFGSRTQPGFGTSQTPVNNVYQGPGIFAQNDSPGLGVGLSGRFGAPAVLGVGQTGGFGAPAVLGAGGVANQLGSLHASGGYANHAGSGNAFANLAPQNAPSSNFGNTVNQPLFGGSSLQASTNSPPSSSIFGRIGLTGQPSAGFGGGSGSTSLQMGKSFQSGAQDSSLWKPRR